MNQFPPRRAAIRVTTAPPTRNRHPNDQGNRAAADSLELTAITCLQTGQCPKMEDALHKIGQEQPAQHKPAGSTPKTVRNGQTGSVRQHPRCLEWKEAVSTLPPVDPQCQERQHYPNRSIHGENPHLYAFPSTPHSIAVNDLMELCICRRSMKGCAGCRWSPETSRNPLKL